jgi:hypothetical protein
MSRSRMPMAVFFTCSVLVLLKDTPVRYGRPPQISPNRSATIGRRGLSGLIE